MRTFYVNTIRPPGASVDIRGPEAQHIHTVVRLKPGDELRLADGRGALAEARVEESTPERVRVRVLRAVETTVESPVKIALAQAYLKDRKMDAIVRPLTELGIDCWIPFAAERCVARPDKRRLDTRVERWKRISREALKQCRRRQALEIVTADSFDAMLQQASVYGLRMLFWEEDGTPFDLDDSDLPTGSVFAAVGPEGGFTAREAEQARRHGFATVGMGPRILRAETAAVTAAALLQYRFGDLGKNS